MRHDLIILKQWIQPQARVLDLGCGDGALLDDLVNEKNISGLGIEIDADNITGCEAKCVVLLNCRLTPELITRGINILIIISR